MGRLSRPESLLFVLLKLYPAAHRRRFEAEMRQTFRDLYHDSPHAGVQFWAGLTFDLLTGAVSEHANLLRRTNVKNLTSMSARPGAIWASNSTCRYT
jgi:hypothetical protein